MAWERKFDEIMASDDGVGVRLLPAGPLCATGPWVKIEPGCEMPKVGRHCLILHSGGRWGIGYWDGEFWWHYPYGDVVTDPTHYAVLRMPEY